MLEMQIEAIFVGLKLKGKNSLQLLPHLVTRDASPWPNDAT